MTLKCCKSFCQKYCLPFYCILWGRDENSWICTRYISGYFIGLFIATFFWYYAISGFCISWESNIWVLGICIAVVVFAFVFNKALRCMLLLLLVGVSGTSGRSYLRALCFASVLTGPIENLSYSAGDVIRVYTCSNVLTYNLTKTRLDLMTKPFQKVLYNIKEDAAEINKTFSEVREFLKPIHNEVEIDDDASNASSSVRPIEVPANISNEEYIQEKYSNKFRKRCEEQMNRGKQRCQLAFVEALEKCEEKIPFILRTMLCWPLKADFVCNIKIFGNLDAVCDPTDAIPRNFGEDYVKLNETENKLFNNTEMKVNYTIHKMVMPPSLIKAEDTGKKIVEEFESRKKIFSIAVSVQEKLLMYFFVIMVIGSVKYHKQYLNNIEADNIYISNYFRHIDERRKKLGKRSLLPLKRREKNKVVDLSNICMRTKSESKSSNYPLLRLSVEILIAVFFILLDYIIVVLLKIIRNESEISYVQEGEHTIKFHIDGDGLMARLLRKTMRNFNIHEHVTATLTNIECLPRPRQLPDSFYIKMAILYSSIIFLTNKSTSFLRLRRIICGYFYRKREKQRTLFLYNSMLRDRHNTFNKLLKDAENNIAKQQLRYNMNVLLKLRHSNPNRYNCLKKFRFCRYKCLICEEFEDDKFIFCLNVNCSMAYCRDCWEDMPDYCIYCKTQIKETKIVNFDSFFEKVPIDSVDMEPHVPETDNINKESSKNNISTDFKKEQKNVDAKNDNKLKNKEVIEENKQDELNKAENSEKTRTKKTKKSKQKKKKVKKKQDDDMLAYEADDELETENENKAKTKKETKKKNKK